MNEDRLLNIETTLAYQDDLLTALNRTVAEQQRTLDGLNRRVEALVERVLELSEASSSRTVIDEKPPHY